MNKDIEDKRRLEEALLDSEERYRLIFEMCDHAIFLTQPDEDTFLGANPAACKMFGYSQEEFRDLGRAALMDVTDTRWQVLLAERSQCGHVRSRVRCTRRSGEVFVVEYVSIAFHDSKGRPRAAVHIRDISEQECAEKDLRESEMRWQFAAEIHGDAMWGWDAEKDEIFLTATAKELFNLPNAESKRPIADLISQIVEEDRALLQGQINDIVAGKASELCVECRFLCSGAMRYVAIRGRVMTRTEDGRPHHIVGICGDLTERKREAAEARRQRILVTHQGRLVLLGELASVLAHEINQPLTAITGFAAACARKTANIPDVLNLVRAIEEQAMRAGNIAWRMRGFARRQSLGRRAQSLVEVVASVARWMRMDTSLLDVVIDISGVDDDLPRVNVDRVELEQVLINLVQNGIEAGLPNAYGQRICIAAGIGKKHDEVEVSVTDWGCGLPATADFDAFQPFVSSKEQGLGLGLTISISIIEGHGGHLWATANPEGGTVFHFTLPLAGSTHSGDGNGA